MVVRIRVKGSTLTLLVALAASVAGASAQTIRYVNGVCGDDTWSGLNPVCQAPDGPKATIQAGVNAAASGDTVLLADAVYRGDGNRDIDFAGRLITLRSENGPEACVIDCQGTPTDPHRAFYFHTGETADAVLDGLKIINGDAVADGPLGHFGGALFCENGSSPSLTHCVLANNRSEWFGGALYGIDSGFTVSDCVFENNFAVRRGSAIDVRDADIFSVTDSTFTGNVTPEMGSGTISATFGVAAVITRCTFTHNIAGGGAGLRTNGPGPRVAACTFTDNIGIFGAAAIGASSLTITDSVFMRNKAQRSTGGAISANGLFMTNCVVADNTAFGSGGGLDIVTGTIINSVFANNRAGTDGGAVRGYDTTWIHCEFTNNMAGWSGGGIWGGTPELIDCTVSGNVAGQLGGGLFTANTRSRRFVNCVFDQNTATLDGGGIYLGQAGSPDIIECILSGNSAGRTGGALFAKLGAPTLMRCAVTGNSAGLNGAGLWLGGNASICSTMITNNTADGRGGGIFSGTNRTRSVFTNCTIADNAAGQRGGGIFVPLDSTPTLVGCVVWANTPEGFGGRGNPVATYSDIQAGFEGAGNINIDPMFVDPAHNDYHLLPDSPCIERGDPDLNLRLCQKDIDGEMRIWNAEGNGAALVDMGADEFGSFFPGDANCDRAVNAFDIEPFLTALNDPAEYESRYPDCDARLVDLNFDGEVNVFDIQPFIRLLFP